jgi:hypothetical protein
MKFPRRKWRIHDWIMGLLSNSTQTCHITGAQSLSLNQRWNYLFASIICASLSYIHILAFRIMVPCSTVHGYQRLGRTYYLNLTQWGWRQKVSSNFLKPVTQKEHNMNLFRRENLKTYICSTLFLSASLRAFSLISCGCSLYRKPSPKNYHVTIIFYGYGDEYDNTDEDTTCRLYLFKWCLSRPVEPCINSFLYSLLLRLPVCLQQFVYTKQATYMRNGTVSRKCSEFFKFVNVLFLPSDLTYHTRCFNKNIMWIQSLAECGYSLDISLHEIFRVPCLSQFYKNEST